MRKKDPVQQQLQLQIEEMQARLSEAEDALQAIRSGEVDAVVVSGPQGDKVYTLQGPEQPYRVLVETMNEGTVTLQQDGTIDYANSRFSETVGMPLEQVIGSPLTRFLPPEQMSQLESLRVQDQEVSGKAEFTLLAADGRVVPAQLSLRRLGNLPDGRSCVVITDLTELKRTEDALIKSLRLLRETEQIGKVGGWEFNVDTGKQTWTEGVYDLHEVDPTYCPTVDKGIEFYTPASRPIIERAVQRAIECGEPFDAELEIVTARGNLRAVHVIGKPDLEHRRISGYFQDITRRKLAEDEIRKLNATLECRVTERTAELAAANQELEAFTSSVAHDLRTPLRAMEGFSLLLLDDYGDQLNEEAKKYIGHIRAGALRMAVLIDDLLNLSRISRTEVRRERADLSGLASACIAGLRESEPERQVEFVASPGLEVEADPNLLRVALENLLGNAWKFSSRKPAARIELGVTDSGGGKEYFVRDNGAGFNMAHAGKLFGPFQRLHSAAEFPGTGIGLATVQHILRKHGGHIRVEAEPDKGATFYFTLGEAKSEITQQELVGVEKAA